MPRYYFDIHAGSLSEWDDDGTEAVDTDAAIAHAEYLISVVVGDITRLGGDRHAVVMIRDRLGNQVATLSGVEGGKPRIILPRPIDRA